MVLVWIKMGCRSSFISLSQVVFHSLPLFWDINTRYLKVKEKKKSLLFFQKDDCYRFLRCFHPSLPVLFLCVICLAWSFSVVCLYESIWTMYFSVWDMRGAQAECPQQSLTSESQNVNTPEERGKKPWQVSMLFMSSAFLLKSRCWGGRRHF